MKSNNFQKLIKRVDMFGKKVELNFDKMGQPIKHILEDLLRFYTLYL
jgi:hypothetical protein